MIKAEVVITVMPDYGMGPYAWEKPASDHTPYVGLCIATAIDKRETEDGTTITDDLHAAFVAWTGDFEQFAERPDFDWKKFQTIDMARLADPNGRGIAMTMSAGFTTINYIGNGNEVECILKLKASNS